MNGHQFVNFLLGLIALATLISPFIGVGYWG